jgi:alpha-ketoglutarate-dependent taurine dioxygenase
VILGSNVARKAPSSLIEVTPSGKALGAEVRSVDIKSFDDWQFAAFMRALLRHQVVLVRGQMLSDRELIAFCRRFGDAGCALQDGDHRSAAEPREIHMESKAMLHAEPSTSATPLAIARVPAPLASVLYAPEAASLGARTAFYSLYAIYDALPPGLRSRVAQLRIKHGGTADDGSALECTQTKRSAASSRVVRPLVGTHPDTGRSMLYLGQRPNARLLGLQKEESDDLLDELWQFAERSEFTWEHALRPGDLLMWDNRCTLRRRHQFNPAGICAVLRNAARRH